MHIMTGDVSQVVLASGNRGKLAEFQCMLEPLNMNMRPQSDFGIGLEYPEAEEIGLTFVENAIIKSRHAVMISGLPAIADDSGLEVDYLNGEPGIYSSRYAGKEASDADNNQKLLTRLAGVKPKERAARFQCVLVYMRSKDDPTPIICHGSWEGSIIEDVIGDHGFGYDPLFLVLSEQCTAAQLPAELKNRLSHRAQAMQQLFARLQESSF